MKRNKLQMKTGENRAGFAPPTPNYSYEYAYGG